jgi:hypothetical protein
MIDDPLFIPYEKRMPLQLELKPNITCDLVLTREAIELLEKAKPTGSMSCLVSDVDKFETFDLHLLIEKFIIVKVVGVKNYFYNLTEFGKMIVNF